MRRPVHGYVPGPKPIFGTYHPPATPVRSVAYVICPPLGWESIQCYTSLRLLGETLAAAGFHTLRIAYDGTGESPGQDEDPNRVRSWLDSIHQAIDAVSGITGVEGVGLVGIRMGATLAAQVAAERPIGALVLWEPCASGSHYAREMEILASAAPAAGKMVAAQGTGQAATPDGIDAGGYVLTRETLIELALLDLWKARPHGNPAVLLLGRDDRPPPARIAERFTEFGCPTSVEQPRGFKEMMVYPEASVPALEGFERIKSWALERSATRTAAAVGETLHLSPELDLHGTHRRVQTFGPERRLFGVLSEPEAEPVHLPPGVLFLTGGVVPRTSVNRMFVALADQLARHGHDALRFDVSGIGESTPEPGHIGGDPYPPSLLSDVQTAISVLRAGDPARPVWIVGLCSGAFAAFRTAIEDRRVVGVVLINPLVYRAVSGTSAAPDVQQHLATSSYRSAMADPRSWGRLFSGKVSLRGPLRVFGRRAKTHGVAIGSRVAALLGFTPGGLAADFLSLRRRRTKVHILFAEGDPGVDALRMELGGSTARIVQAGVDLETIEGADHTFNASRIRHELIERIVGLISPNGAG